MSDVLLTLHCAAVDTDSVIDALRQATRVPVHVRAETVHGRDFEDAHAHEQVTATLRRSAIELVASEAALPAIMAAVDAAKRRSPVRWHVTPVSARGRIL